MRKKIAIPAALLTAALAAGGLLYVTYGHPFAKADAAPTPPAVPIQAVVVTKATTRTSLLGRPSAVVRCCWVWPALMYSPSEPPDQPRLA